MLAYHDWYWGKLSLFPAVSLCRLESNRRTLSFCNALSILWLTRDKGKVRDEAFPELINRCFSDPIALWPEWWSLYPPGREDSSPDSLVCPRSLAHSNHRDTGTLVPLTDWPSPPSYNNVSVWLHSSQTYSAMLSHFSPLSRSILCFSARPPLNITLSSRSSSYASFRNL